MSGFLHARIDLIQHERPRSVTVITACYLMCRAPCTPQACSETCRGSLDGHAFIGEIADQILAGTAVGKNADQILAAYTLRKQPNRQTACNPIGLTVTTTDELQPKSAKPFRNSSHAVGRSNRLQMLA